MGKVGRRSKPYRTSWGVEVFGLAHDTDGRWRIVATGEKWRDTDERKAVRKFFELTDGAKIQVTPTPTESARLTDELKTLTDEYDVSKNRHEKQRIAEVMSETYRRSVPDEISEAAFWLRVADEFSRNPAKVAKMTGIPALADIDPSALPKPAILLTALIDLYDEKKITTKSKYRARREWEKMGRITGAKSLSDLTQEVLVGYRKQMEEENGAGTRVWVFGCIKSVISWGLKADRPLDAKQIDSALSRCACLRVDDERPHKRPNPISPNNLAILLKNAVGDNAYWRPMILVALNCCLSVDEMARLEWADFYLDAEQPYYYTIRNKTRRKGVPRAAMLWPETVKELKAIKRVGPHVFTSSHGVNFSTQVLCDYFRDFRLNVCGIPDAPDEEPSLSFQALRDGCFTRAAYGATDERYARVLGGHTSGMRDHYVSRHPEITQSAVDAVREYYRIENLCSPHALRLAM
jgi:integrase